MCEPASRSRSREPILRATAFFIFLFSFLIFNSTLMFYLLHLAEETKAFDFLSSVKFRASSVSVCIKFNFIEQILGQFTRYE